MLLFDFANLSLSPGHVQELKLKQFIGEMFMKSHLHATYYDLVSIGLLCLVPLLLQSYDHDTISLLAKSCRSLQRGTQI